MRKLAIFFESSVGKRIKNMIIGVGAAVVMLGALFKLQSWPGASYMLIAGLCTEAFIFALQGILPPHKDYYWEKLYPDLDVSPEEEEMSKGHVESQAYKGSITEQLDDMLDKANVESALIERLGQNLGKLGDNLEKMSDIADAGNATNEYSENARQAAQVLSEMKNAYQGATDAAQSLSSATEEANSYQEQMGILSKNISSLNSIYEVELQDASNHLKTINQFYGTLSSALENLNESVDDAQVYREQMANLSKNMTALNNVYGSMLSGMANAIPRQEG